MDYGSEEVICPYYMDREDKRMIQCEGPVANTYTIVKFKRGATKSRHRNRYCITMNYKSCPIAQMCASKYKK